TRRPSPGRCVRAADGARQLRPRRLSSCPSNTNMVSRVHDVKARQIWCTLRQLRRSTLAPCAGRCARNNFDAATVAARGYLCSVSIRALLTLVVLARGAAAGTLVRWQAPETCPDDAVVDERVASRLGSDARAAAPIDVTVHHESTG